MTLANFIKAWRSFWFEPQSPTPVALFRILFGFLLLQSILIHTWPGLFSWYGDHAIVSFDSVKQYFWHKEPRFDLLLIFPQNNQGILIFFILYVLATFCMMIGFCTRFSTIFVALALISIHHHNPFNLNGGDNFLRLAAIFLACSHAGDAFSLDQLLKKKNKGKPTTVLCSPWAQRMLQVQMAIIYWHSFCCKIVGAQWLDGTAVYYATRLDDLFRFPLPPLLDNLFVCKLLSWYTIIIEFGMWALVWFKELRYFFLIGAFLLHFGIDLVLNLPVFEWAFIAGLINFIEPKDITYAKQLLNQLLTKANILNRVRRSSD